MKSARYIRGFLLITGGILALSLACGPSNTPPSPATPTGGGAQPTATRPAATGGQPTAPAGGGAAEAGKQLVTTKGCIACHTISGVPGAVGTIGPNLSDIGDAAKHPKLAGGLLDNNTDNLKKWLANPPAVKPGTVMPNLNLTPQEVDGLVAFLQTLK